MCRTVALLAGVCLALAAVATARNNDSTARFDAWLDNQGKAYETDEEYYARATVFADNAAMVDAHNADPTASYTMALNKFADLSPSEFSARLLGGRRVPGVARKSPAFDLRDDNLPSSVNWATKGVTPPITSIGLYNLQGSVSAVTTQALATAIAIKNGDPVVTLSAFELDGCVNATEVSVGTWYDYLHDYGVCTNADYKFSMNACNRFECTPAAFLSDYVNVTASEAALQAAVAQQTVVVEVDAEKWQFYASGVFDNKDCGSQVDHTAVVVGYGEDNGKKIWIISNEWGNDWGEEGFIYLLRGENLCAVQDYASYPVPM